MSPFAWRHKYVKWHGEQRGSVSKQRIAKWNIPITEDRGLTNFFLSHDGLSEWENVIISLFHSSLYVVILICIWWQITWIESCLINGSSTIASVSVNGIFEVITTCCPERLYTDHGHELIINSFFSQLSNTNVDTIPKDAFSNFPNLIRM